MSVPSEPNVQDYLYKAFDHVAQARGILGNGLDLAKARKAKGLANDILLEVFHHITMAFMYLEKFEQEASSSMVHIRGKPYLIHKKLQEDLASLLKSS